MRKMLIMGILFIILGFIIGNIIFGNNKLLIRKNRIATTYYLLQEGVYSSEESIKKNLSTIPIKAYDIDNNQYYVYLGITKDYEVANKLKKIYSNRGYKTYIKKKTILSPTFSNNINQLDLLIKKTEEEDKILMIEEIALSSYMKNVRKK